MDRDFFAPFSDHGQIQSLQYLRRWIHECGVPEVPSGISQHARSGRQEFISQRKTGPACEILDLRPHVARERKVIEEYRANWRKYGEIVNERDIVDAWVEIVVQMHVHIQIHVYQHVDQNTGE